MIAVKELKTDNRFTLPKEFLSVMPETCPVCGSVMEVNEGLTELRCTNSVCPSKLTTRMVKMFESLGVLGMGASRCAGIVKHYAATSPYIIFKICHRDGTFDTFYDYYQIVLKDVKAQPIICDSTDAVAVVNEFTDFLKANGLSKDDCKLQHIRLSDSVAQGIVEQVNKARTMLLYEFVKFGNYEGLQSSAAQLFKDYTSLDAFYADFDKGGVDFIKQKLDIKQDNVVSIRAESIYSTLQSARAELYEYIDYIDLRETQKVMNICISTAVGAPYKNKADFIKQMNDKYGEKCYLNMLGSVSKKCEYLVWSKQGAATSKVEKATALNIPIMTGVEFDEMMQKQFG